MTQKLKINCATCDARNVLEENYAHYKQITVNCSTVLTSPSAKAVLNKLPFTLNCASALEMESDVHVRTINGSDEIRSSDAVPISEYYLLVNGALTIGPDTQQQLAKCVGMTINGRLTCPESIYAILSGVNVNGAVNCYPDNAIVLKRNAVIDKLFTLRAKKKQYWSGRRMIMVDPELDVDKLKNKGATFSTKEVIISESKVESLIDLIDERAEIIIVPDGTAVVMDDMTLDEDTLCRYGEQLYVIGDVTVPENTEALEKLKYLNVRGDAKVSQEHKKKLLDVLTEISGSVLITKAKGVTLQEQSAIKITRWMLEKQPLGIAVCDCGVVTIADDIPKELIVERLYIEDCGAVQCCQELEDAVSMICMDCGSVGSEENQDGMDMDEMMNDDLETKVINAADYVL